MFPANMSGQPTTQALRTFLGARESSQHFRLILPEFGSPGRLHGAAANQEFFYRGNAFAERDTRAASHIQTLLDQVVQAGNVSLQGAGNSVPPEQISFLFGSRSNWATAALLKESGTNLFQFEFGDDWSIICSGLRFSLPDPTILTPAKYAVADDYGVIARVHSATGTAAFMIAGLGGRATEGCGLYFREHWSQLDRRFGSKDFAVVLKFPAPFDVKQAEVVASASELVRPS